MVMVMVLAIWGSSLDDLPPRVRPRSPRLVDPLFCLAGVHRSGAYPLGPQTRCPFWGRWALCVRPTTLLPRRASLLGRGALGCRSSGPSPKPPISCSEGSPAFCPFRGGSTAALAVTPWRCASGARALPSGSRLEMVARRIHTHGTCLRARPLLYSWQHPSGAHLALQAPLCGHPSGFAGLAGFT